MPYPVVNYVRYHVTLNSRITSLINISRHCQPYMLSSDYGDQWLTVHFYSLILHCVCFTQSAYCLFLFINALSYSYLKKNLKKNSVMYSELSCTYTAHLAPSPVSKEAFNYLVLSYHP